MKLTDYAKKQGICYRTAWNWFKNGNIPGAYQTETGTIIVPEEKQHANKNTVIYCRVSNHSRKKEIDYQVERCSEFARANGLEIYKVYKEIASGMNDNRRKLWEMINSDPGTIIVENKDRLTRFGFNYLEKLLEKQGTKIMVINRDEEDQADLLKDLVAIVTSFCCRLYGMRRGLNKTKKIKQELNQ